ncbi:pilus assembly protein [Solihabitans fulvus]|uniref:Pilus assembly protein n=2 Tax=Solihabitans fulvus TaxID=1892852 RepID=A0A5B2XGY5_9PSEU|nr:pilus assembly protein [Solihabitans fulvus]
MGSFDPTDGVDPPDGERGGDRGAVTVEAAVALGALAFALVLGLLGLQAILGELRCTDAAREAARLVARGEQSRAAAAVAQIGPKGAELTVATDGDTVRAEVRAEPVGGLLPGVHLRAEAYAVIEPAAAEPAVAKEGGGG